MSHREHPHSRPEPDPLPFATVDWVFSRIAVRYGHFFLGRWDGIDLGVVKEDWRYQLAGLSDAQLEHGLKHLAPGNPPDAGQFRKTCLDMPAQQEAPPKLPPPRGRMQLRPEIRAAIEQLLEPAQDGKEPYRVTVARRFVAHWDGKPHMSLRQQQDLAHFKRVIERFESSKPEAIAAAKEAAQRATESYVGGAHVD